MQIVTGDFSVNKKQHLIKKMWDLHQENPQAIIFYLVPEHLKFDMENELLEQLQVIQGSQAAATYRIQVVSISRLAWFLLDKTNQGKVDLSDIGNLMVIKQVLIECAHQLVVYKGQEKHLGFAEKLKTLFDELLQANITPEDLSQNQEIKGLDMGLPNMEEVRLEELRLLYKTYLNQMEVGGYQHYTAIDQMIDWLAGQEGPLPYYFFFDHYDYFNAKEYQLLVHLEKKSQGLWISLPLTHQQVSSNQWNPVVTVPQNTYSRLKEMAGLFDFKLEPDWDIRYPYDHYDTTLLKAVKQYQVVQSSGQQIEPIEEGTPIYLRQFVTPQEEIKYVANQIYEAVKVKGYRYQDIRVLTRDIAYYQQFLDPYFKMNQIPYFIDNQSQMAQSSLVGLLEGIFQLKLSSWSYQALMMVLKSNLLVPPWLQDDLMECQHQKAAFENFLLSNGFFSFRFYSPQFEWRFPEAEQPFINHLGQESPYNQGQVFGQWRDWLNTIFGQGLATYKTSLTGSQAAKWLYTLLSEGKIRERMITLRDQAIEKGDLGQSRRLEQVWQVLMDTLDEFHLLYQEKSILFKDFYELLMAGLSSASYHIIPPTLDQVMITSIESPQVKPAKLVFVLGLNHQVLPQYKQADSLLSESNRKQIQEGLLAHQYLTDQVQLSNLNEPLIAYKTLLSASQELNLSYASNVEGQQMTLSPLMQHWANTIGLKLQIIEADETRLETGKWQSGQLGQAKMILSNLLWSIRRSFDTNQVMSPLNQALIKWVSDQVLDTPVLVQKLFRFHHLPTYLNPTTARLLYGNNLSMSASRLEVYYQDPFSHFLQYGLRLRERQVFQINPVKTGEYYHHILDLVLDKIPNLAKVEEVKIQEVLEAAIQSLEEDMRYNLFISNPRLQAIKRQMDFQMRQFLDFSRRQSLETNPVTLKTEALFGMGASTDFDALTYELETGQVINLRGKIDRIDRLGSQNFIQVIDYKSGQKQFDLVKFYEGLDLQLMTYLQVALQHYDTLMGTQGTKTPDEKVVGSFYQPLVQTYTKADQDLLDYLTQNPKNRNYLLEENTLNGFIGLNEENLISINPNLKENGYSLVYPAKLTSRGVYNSHTLYWDPLVLKAALKHTEKKIIQAANEILQGKIEMLPYKDLRQYTLSLKPDYRVISGFDATVHYANYRHYQYQKKEILSQLRQAGEDLKGGESDD